MARLARGAPPPGGCRGSGVIRIAGVRSQREGLFLGDIHVVAGDRNGGTVVACVAGRDTAKEELD